VDHRLFIPLLIATLIAFPARSHADDTRWESLRVDALADGQSVAVPAESPFRSIGEIVAAARARPNAAAEIARRIAAIIATSAASR